MRPPLGSLTDSQRAVLRTLRTEVRTAHAWTVLGAAVGFHARAGVCFEEIADSVELGMPRVLEIRLRHPGSDPAVEYRVGRQVGE